MGKNGEKPLHLLLMHEEIGLLDTVKQLLAGRVFQSASGAYQDARVDWVGTYPDAVRAFQNAQHQVYLVGERLDAASGLQVLEAAAVQGVRAPLIFLAREENRALEQSAREANAADFLVEEFLNGFYLEKSIARVLDRALEQRQIADQVSALSASLETEQRKLHAILDHSPNAIVIADAEGQVRFSNPAAQQWFGRAFFLGAAEEDAEFSLYTPGGDPLPRQAWPLVRSAAHGETETNLEMVVKRSDERHRDVLVNSAPILGQNGKVAGAVAIFQDITRQKSVEAAAQKNVVRIANQRRLIQFREAERLRVAREIHDVAIQDLFAISYMLSEAQDLARKSDESKIPNAEAILERLALLQDAIFAEVKKLRSFTNELRPPALAPFGLEKAIRSHADVFHEQNPELNMHLSLMEDRKNLTEQVRLTLFRIYQELLQNFVRHACVEDVYIRLSLDADQVILEVKDYGVGFDVPEDWSELVQDGHFGLMEISEQAEALGGRVQITSRHDAGTEVQVTIPRKKVAVFA